MTILQRAATIAAMTFSLAGLIGASSPVLATDLDRSTIPVPASTQTVQASNASSISEVPQAPPVTNAALPVTPDTREFDSLADAVAAQDAGNDDEAMRCLAGAVYFEAKGEPLAGQLAVANVILNRTKSGRFPTDICAVIKQRGQFGFVRGGEIPLIDDNHAYRTAIAVAKVALGAAWDGAASAALYFNTPNRMPGAHLTRIAMIGHHVFYR